MANDFNLNGAKITITNVSKSINFSYDDKGTISPTNKISNKINTDEIIQPVEIEIPSWISYRNMTINPGETISFETNKIKEIMYYLELSKNPIEGIKIDISAIEGSTSEPILIEKTITENNTYNAADDNADGYSTVNVNVSATTPIPGTRSGAIIRDYDGSVIASYTPTQFAALTAYPAQPVHTGLTGQGYNWTLANAKAYVAKYGYVEVGATYITDDGKTRFYIFVESADTEGTISLGLNGTAVIDWGDSSETDTITGEDIETSIDTSHTYTTVGKYTITINVTDGSASFMGTDFELGKVEIGSNVISIDNNAFYDCSTLTSIIIPKGITSIIEGGFSGCNALTSIIIPEGVTEIGDNMFSSCNALTSITIPETVTSIGQNAFYDCYALSAITIPEGVTEIGNSAFKECYVLTSIIIPEGVTSIDMEAFYACYALSSITIPETVTEIGGYVFYECYNLSSITIPEGVTSIGDNAFTSCYNLSSITIPETVTEIGSYAFYGCYELTSITIPEGVTSIGDNAFTNCYALSSITIPDGVTKISDSMFYYCYALSSITIPDGVTSISQNAFYYCYALSSIIIPETVTEIGGNAFNGCRVLTSITFESITPPTINSNAFEDINKFCTIYVPTGTLEAYTTAENYPDPTIYTYVEY